MGGLAMLSKIKSDQEKSANFTKLAIEKSFTIFALSLKNLDDQLVM